MSDPLVGPKLKVARAYQQVREVEREINVFLNTQPNTLTPDFDPKRANLRYKYKYSDPVPPIISVICGELFHNLRSALDQLMNCVLAQKIGMANIRKGGFPIETNREKFEASSQYGKVKKLFPEAAALLDKLEPYKGGNSPLWLIHHLNVMDKHKILNVINTPTPSTNVQDLAFDEAGAIITEVPVWHPMGDNIQITIGKAIARLQEKISAAFVISFSEVESLKGNPILVVLQQFCDFVERVIGIFEREFFKS